MEANTPIYSLGYTFANPIPQKAFSDVFNEFMCDNVNLPKMDSDWFSTFFITLASMLGAGAGGDVFGASNVHIKFLEKQPTLPEKAIPPSSRAESGQSSPRSPSENIDGQQEAQEIVRETATDFLTMSDSGSLMTILPEGIRSVIGPRRPSSTTSLRSTDEVSKQPPRVDSAMSTVVVTDQFNQLSSEIQFKRPFSSEPSSNEPVIKRLRTQLIFKKIIDKCDGIKIFFTTTKIVTQNGKKIDRKQLNVKTVLFEKTDEDNRSSRVTEEELLEMGTSLINSLQMKKEEWLQFVENTIATRFNLESVEMFKAGAVGKRKTDFLMKQTNVENHISLSIISEHDYGSGQLPPEKSLFSVCDIDFFDDNQNMVRNLKRSLKILSSVPSLRESEETFSRKLRINAKIFFEHVNFFIQNLFTGWNIALPFKWGADCSIISAILHALQKEINMHQTIFHYGKVGEMEGLLLILKRGPGIDPFPPILIDFANPTSALMLNRRPEGISFLSTVGIHCIVDLKCNDLRVGSIVGFENNFRAAASEFLSPPNAASLLLQNTKIFARGAFDISVVMRNFMDELNHILSPDYLYGVTNPSFASRYIAGMLAASERTGFKIYSLRPMPGKPYATAFLIADQDTTVKVCIHVIESVSRTTVQLQSVIGQSFHTRESIGPDDVVVYNLFVGYQHHRMEFSNPEERHHDYVNKQMVVSKINVESLHQQFDSSEVPFCGNLENKLIQVVNRDLDLLSVAEDFHTALSLYDFMISEEQHIAAIGAGLMHYNRNMNIHGINVLNPLTSQQTLLSSIRARPLQGAPDLDIPLTLNFLLGTTSDSLHNVISVQHLVLNFIYRPHFESIGPGLLAAFKDFGDETPEPAYIPPRECNP